MSNIAEIRLKTLQDIRRKLDKYGKVCCIRPTGFGKTVIASQLMSEYQNVLFLYPLDIIKDSVEERYSDNVDNVTFMSYTKLARMKEVEIKSLPQYDLIISDECHKLGGDNTAINCETLFKCQDGHKLGMTATPERMDLFDVVGVFFDDVTVFRYTLHDAFEGKTLLKPFYCYCSYDIKKDVQVACKNVAGTKEEKREQFDIIKSSYIEACKIFNIDKIIRDVCTRHTDTNYMKFIVFFGNNEHLEEKSNDVQDWFHKAFPKHRIRTIRITSNEREFIENRSKLSDLKRKDNTIDLVYSIDMLNMGYHVENLTGIVMYRGTESHNIFYQQLGRILNSGSGKEGEISRGIVFDIVDNLHVNAIYDILGKKSNKTLEWRRLLIKTAVERGLLQKSLASSKVELEKLINGAIFNIEGINEIIREFKGKGYTRSVSDPHGYNDLTDKDLIATGHEAMYRDLIRKIVAEPISMRARQAYYQWKERGGKDDPRTREFILSQKNPPLEVFAKVKQVSTEAVLKEMGL